MKWPEFIPCGNKFIFPKIEEKGFRYEKTNIEKLNHRTNDLVRGKIHREIQEDEDNNTTVKSLHFFEKRTETNLISYIRNKNFRNIKKYQKLDKKIENIEKEVEKIDYNGANLFKTNLITYLDNIDKNIEEASKSTNEQKYNISEGIYLNNLQGYLSFIDSIQ